MGMDCLVRQLTSTELLPLTSHPRASLSLIATLLCFGWWAPYATRSMNVAQDSSSSPVLLLIRARTVVISNDDSSNHSNSDILLFPWISCVLVLLLFAVAVAHFTFTSIYFTRLGSMADPKSGSIVILTSNVADPDVRTVAHIDPQLSVQTAYAEAPTVVSSDVLHGYDLRICFRQCCAIASD